MAFNGDRLRLLRHFHALTQSDLADRVAVSQPAIADYELMWKEPQREVVDALAAVLAVRPDFFFDQDDERFAESEYNFRRRTTASDRLKKKVAAQAALFGSVVRTLRRYVRLPPLDLPSLPVQTADQVEQAAERAREHWNLGTGDAISSMTRLLEGAGVVVTVADRDTAEKVDAFSRYGATSVVVLNTAKGSTSRAFFDTAHEAGHGVLHFRGPLKAPEDREREADGFAAAFLMPRRAFTRDFWSGRLDWSNLFEMKRKWGASLQAIIRRAYQLALVDAATYRTAFRQLSRRGWRTDEPDEPAAESPELFRAALDTVKRDTGKTPGALASELHLTPGLFGAVTGLVSDDGIVSSLSEYRNRTRVSLGEGGATVDTQEEYT